MVGQVAAGASRLAIVMWLWGCRDDEGMLAKVFGIQRSAQANLWRVGLRHPASHREPRDGVPGTQKGSDLIYDQSTRWSIFDMFESDHSPGEPEPQVIRCCSALVEVMTKLLAIIACWSTVWPTLVAAYWPLLKDDPRWGFTAWRFHAAQGFDLSMDAVYCACTLLRLRTSTLDPLMAFETCSPATLARRELRSFKFWVDLVTCLPWALFVPTGPVPAVFACIKVFRLRFLAKPAPSSLILPQDVDLVARSLMLVLVSGHLLSCAYFCLLWYTDTFGRRPYFELTANTVRHGLGEHYADALRNSVNLVLGADMEGYTDLENFLHVVWTPVGIMANALLFSQILVVISRRFTLENQECVESHKMRSCMQTLSLPSALQLRIFAHYTYERVHKGHGTIDTLAGGLSEQLNFELHLARHFRLILVVPMFKKVQPLLLQEIVSVLQDSVFLPGDFICRFGDEGKEMFFVHRGVCAVLTQDMTVIRYVHENECIGELSLLTGKQRSASVRAVDFCMVAELSKENFDRIMKRFPDQLQVIVSGFSEEQKSAILQFGRKLKNETLMTGMMSASSTSSTRFSRNFREPSRECASPMSASSVEIFHMAPSMAEPELGALLSKPSTIASGSCEELDISQEGEGDAVPPQQSSASQQTSKAVDESSHSETPVTFLRQVTETFADSIAAAKSKLRRSISTLAAEDEPESAGNQISNSEGATEPGSPTRSTGSQSLRLAWPPGKNQKDQADLRPRRSADQADLQPCRSAPGSQLVTKKASISNRASELLKRSSVSKTISATLGASAGRRTGAAGLGSFSAGSGSPRSGDPYAPAGKNNDALPTCREGFSRAALGRKSAERGERRKSTTNSMKDLATKSLNDLAPHYFQRVQQAGILAQSADLCVTSEQEVRGAVDACMEVQQRTGHYLNKLQAAWEGQLALVHKERRELQVALSHLVEKMIVAKQQVLKAISEDNAADLALQAMSVVEREMSND